jgi:putative SOS response-associated peptidase YedK
MSRFFHRECGHSQTRSRTFSTLRIEFLSIPRLKKTAHNTDIHSYTILTCPPNDLIASVHNRMPVILSREQEDTWLNPDIVEPEQLQPLLVPYPEKEMEMYPITTVINNPKNDREDVLQPATP